MRGLYAIIDLPHPHGLTLESFTVGVLADRLEGGIDGASIVQLRAKHATTAERVGSLRRMLPICQRAGVPLIVNDDVEAAMAVPGLAGVHLGQSDPGADDVARIQQLATPPWKVGLSTHDLTQFKLASRQRPGYVALGPIAPTRSKANPEPVVGFETLLEACRLAITDVVAIGGLTEASARRAAQCGAHFVATIGALIAPTEEATAGRARTLARALREAAEPLPLSQVAEEIPVLPVQLLIDLARWSDDVGVLVELGLPARFRPCSRAGEVAYRPSDVLDLLMALGKQPDESWSSWTARIPSEQSALVQLRIPRSGSKGTH